MSTELSSTLAELRDALARVRLPIDLPGADTQRAAAREIVDQLNDYVLPRLDSLEAPLLAVVGGSTGAGKSTLVNSLIGRRVTIPGVIRPTTRAPVLIYHPDDEGWFLDDRILPGLARSHSVSHDTRALQLVAEPTLPGGLAILDAPDIDSVVTENRELANQLLQAADLWLFVTSAARYADAVPWEYLRQAAARAAAVAVVCDRVPPAAMDEVPADLARLMTLRGLGDWPLFAVPETPADADGLLPDAAVAPIRYWLADLAADQASRQAVVMQTLDGAIGHLELRAPRVALAVRDQVEAVERLRTDADEHFAEAARTIAVQTADGTLLRGEVLARWQDFVGTGEFFRAFEEKVSRLRDRIKSWFVGPPKGATDVRVAVEAGLEVLIIEEAQKAAERTEAAWRADPAGRQVIAEAGLDLSRLSPEFAREVGRSIRDWQGDVMDLVADEGQAKRITARFAALGVNGVGIALMLVVFAQTGGLTGAEVGVAGGTAVVAQKLMETIFGDEAVRRLARQAKTNLDDRVQGLVATELVRFHEALARQSVEPEQANRIDAAVTAMSGARRLGLPAGGSRGRAELPTGERAALTPTTANPATAQAPLAIEQAIDEATVAELLTDEGSSDEARSDRADSARDAPAELLTEDVPRDRS